MLELLRGGLELFQEMYNRRTFYNNSCFPKLLQGGLELLKGMYNLQTLIHNKMMQE